VATTLGRAEPYIIQTEELEEVLYHTMVDGLFMYTALDLSNALIDIFCYYYVLNIKYPKTTAPFFVFFQHFILGIKDSGKLSNSALTLFSKLR
jgi:hypothetical protein